MYSAGLAESAAAVAAATSDASAAASAPHFASPPRTASYSQHGPHGDGSYYARHQGHAGGGDGGGAPGWEQGDRLGVEGDWGWPKQGPEDGHSGDGDALLVRWSEGLDFDRQALPSRVVATAAGAGASGAVDVVVVGGGGVAVVVAQCFDLYIDVLEGGEHMRDERLFSKTSTTTPASVVVCAGRTPL